MQKKLTFFRKSYFLKETFPTKCNLLSNGNKRVSVFHLDQGFQTRGPHVARQLCLYGPRKQIRFAQT